jgi:hypothetical protein
MARPQTVSTSVSVREGLLQVCLWSSSVSNSGIWTHAFLKTADAEKLIEQLREGLAKLTREATLADLGIG